MSDEAFPQPFYKTNYFLIKVVKYLPVVTALSFLFLVPLTLKAIVAEKSEGIKEFLKMMGLPSFYNWAAWFTSTMLTCFFSVVFMTLLLCVDFRGLGVLPASNSLTSS